MMMPHRGHQKSFELAQATLGLQLQLSGALGVRTKFQTKDVAQLVLLASSARPNTALDASPAVPQVQQSIMPD